ncbi:asparagine synthase (glutamine-hydrolyzing) [Dactylosporangium matsuzakiense]|uniref:asparagine synthase (glutamine-hydrolyzing) n=1 Tax=Dactylosporangium matsuzakiense TaxID=53360 RepID=A0A9W6NK28_9ACTN|nr:asparagine synthase (glutamine-hydrolyzing) [Dactylosporangium matsuzakiense]UWZ42561.1 asparagine synthase (glutamine-hydrolyzing) [Dactylosporangium matsuzakiense]GLL00520.1 asparagine synthetase B [Dactylosporangium matsuzakiense]
MCGVVGWVALGADGRDLRREVAAVRAMTGTMTLRGPDAEGLWVRERVAFGHRRLAVIDLVTGDQPMTVEHAAITYSGELYNYRELRTELRGHGHEFRTESDTEVVLRAYLQWGEDFVDHLNGMYAFGLWDARTETLLLVRDRMGVKPLYYYTGVAGSLLFASEPKAVFAHPQAEAVVDLEGLRELLAFVKTPGLALYRDLHEVVPGSYLRVSADGVRRRQYWRPSYAAHRDDRETTVRTIRGLLDDIVARQTIADVPLCALLSGGLDSSAITALANAALTGRGEGPLRSFAVDFTGQAENFRPDPMRATPDTPFVHDVVKHVSVDHEDIVLSSATLMDPLSRSAVVAAMDQPALGGDIYTSLYLLFRAVREHSTVALSGEAADEVFGGYAWFHVPAIVRAETFPWLALGEIAGVRNAQQGGAQLVTSALEPSLDKSLRLPEYRAAAYRDAIAEVDHGEDADPHNRRMREMSYLHLTRFVQILLDRKDRMSMAHGLEVRVPFCDHRLVQYVYNTPWALKTFDGREKSLLRAATADVLPASVVARTKSPYPSTQDARYEQALREALVTVATDSPAASLFDTRRLADLAAAPYEHDGFGQARRQIEQVLALDLWLRHSPVRLKL